MKTKFIIFLSVMMVAGCNLGEEYSLETKSNENQETVGSEKESNKSFNENSNGSSNLLELSNNDKGWINFEGNLGGNQEYRTTPSIKYNSEFEYELTVGAYVSYFKEDEFIKTVQQEYAGPIEQVKEADNIRVSYNHSFKDRIALNKL